MSIHKSFAAHIDGLHNAGLATVMYTLAGRIDMPRLCRSFNMFIQRKHPGITGHHFFWFKTEEGVVISYAGNSFLLEAVDQFMTKAIKLGIVGSATLDYSGRSKRAFMALLDERLTQYTPIANIRSFGGTHHNAGK
ncbi:hypothetical protein ACSFE6_04730 [Pseudomonas baetica]|uniref:hypothetical protein n=1 Tax=Pseudomonas baetica TaxID=674054 RepID=UPI003EF016F3